MILIRAVSYEGQEGRGTRRRLVGYGEARRGEGKWVEKSLMGFDEDEFRFLFNHRLFDGSRGFRTSVA